MTSTAVSSSESEAVGSQNLEEYPGRCCPPVSNRNVVPLSALIQVVLNPRKPLPPCRTAASNPTTGADLASGARAITHERGVLQGPQTLMKRFPQNATNNQRPMRLITT